MDPNHRSLDFSHGLATKFGRWGTAFLRMLPPEWSHELGMRFLEKGMLEKMPHPQGRNSLATVGLKTSLPAIGDLSHPIGLAAGFDKNARCPGGFKEMGFSFLEMGTVTPLPQKGNSKPRLFRQTDQRALINRMGFNNDGSQKVAERLRAMAWDHNDAPLGINAGKNKLTPAHQAVADYMQVLTAFKGLARYYVINISSPNTIGLRDLANKHFIKELAESLEHENKEFRQKTWVKLDPDMEKKLFQEVTAAVAEHGFAGLVVSNTHRVAHPEAGGQSGHPLAILATECLEWAFEVHKGVLPMIGCGGILSGSDILQKMIRGASAVQIYTALVYRGPWVVWELLEELSYELKLRGFSHVRDALHTFYQDRSLGRSLS